MSEPSTVQDDILQALRAHGPLTRTQIMERCFLFSEATKCGNALYRLKTARCIERGPHKTWQLTDREAQRLGREQPPVEERPNTPSPAVIPRPQDDIAPTHSQPRSPTLQAAILKHGGGIQATLTRAAQQAQDALDEYVWAVGNSAILGPLMASRDAARQALEAYEVQS